MSWERVTMGIAAIAAVAVLLALLWPVARHRLIYPGGTLSPDRSDPSAHGLPHGEEVWLEADDGVRIHAWWVPARGAGAAGSRSRNSRSGGGASQDPGAEPDGSRDADGRGAVVYCHGNAETMATRAWIADRLSRLGYHTLLFDYRGYGLSQGRASEEGLARDARAAWGHVVGSREVPPDRVVLMGHSLGSAVATRLALEVQETGGPPVAEGPTPPGSGPRPAQGSSSNAVTTGSVPTGLVVGSPFPDMPALFAHHAPWLPGRALRWGTDRLAAGSRLGDVRAPVLVVIGTEDDVIPPAMSRAVHAAADAAEGSAGEVDGPTGAAESGGPTGTATSGSAAGEAAPPTLVTVPADHAAMMGHPDVWAALEVFLARALPRR